MATLGTLGRTTEIPNAAVGGAKSKTELEYLRPEAEGALTTQNVSLDDASMAQVTVNAMRRKMPIVLFILLPVGFLWRVFSYRFRRAHKPGSI
ncbi:MAG: hypothetical protein H0T92_10375 [Pyrinomonadaceae bacterium]|nr:hypothetical protein [Pyrinomonadaceae bacterium]